MKKIKKLIVAISLFCLNFMAFSALFKPEATASIKRFDVDGLEEVMSAKTDELTVFGSYFWYGGIQMKSYLYQKYDSKNDIMYYFVFTDTGINGRGYKYHKPNWFKTEHHYFNSKKMHIEVHFNLVNEKNGKLLEQLEEVNYYPETSKHENTLSSSYSYSMSIGLQGGYSGGSGSISGSLTSTIGYQYTTATTYEDVEVLANEYYPGKKYDSIDYLFLKANLKAETLPCKGEVLRVSSFVYALEDYSKAFNNQHLLLDIKYEGYIHRASSTTDCEMMKRIEHEYVIDKNRTIVNQNTKEQNISYDVTANNLQRKDLTEYN